MPIPVNCPTCGTTCTAPDHMAGGRVRCPKCSATLGVPTQPPLAVGYPALQDSGGGSRNKQCPFCGEQVLEVAKKCKHCGETIDVALRAAEEAKRSAEKGPTVFMNAGGGGAAASSSSSAASSSGGTLLGLSLLVWAILGFTGITMCCIVPSCVVNQVGKNADKTFDDVKKKLDEKPKKSDEPKPF